MDITNGEDLNKKLVLVAEDDDISFAYQRSILREASVRVIRAVDGLEAVEIFKSTPEINLVVMDINMPRMDGIEATKKILEIKNDMPVIAVTAYSISDFRKKAYQVGCIGFVSKPIIKNEFLKLIRANL